MFETFFRAASRTLRHPLHVALYVGVLGSGLAAVLAAYAVHRAVVSAPLPFADQDALLRIRESRLPRFPDFTVAPGKFVAWQRNANSFASLSAFRFTRPVATSFDEPVRLSGAQVTAEYFETLGVTLRSGAGFAPQRGSAQAVLSESARDKYFSEHENPIGQTLLLDGISHEIVGVAPALPYPRDHLEVYTLWHMSAAEAGQIAQHSAHVVGRLAAGASQASATEELQRISRHVEVESGARGGWTAKTVPIMDDFVGEAASRVGLFSAVAAMLTLAAFSSLLILGALRWASREAEQAVRSALGAARRRVLAELTAEGLALGLMGVVVSLAFSQAAVSGLRYLAPPGLPRIDNIMIDSAVLAAGAAVGLAMALSATLLPALLRPASSQLASLRAGARTTLSRRAKIARASLVTIKVAMAVVLGTSAVALGNYYAAISNVKPGFDAENSYFASIAPPRDGYESPERLTAFYRALVDAVGGVPGVDGASVSQALPMVRNWSLAFDIEGEPTAPGEPSPSGTYYAATANHLQVLGVPLISGRAFGPTDHAHSLPVALVSETFAKLYFPTGEPVGQRIRAVNESQWREVVGVVEDVRQKGLSGEVGPQVYAPFEQLPFREAHLVVRVIHPSPALFDEVAERVRQIEPLAASAPMQSFSTVIERSVATDRFLRTVVTLLALIAILLAAAGVYGTLANAIAQTRSEIGVRLALGSSPSNELLRVLRQGAGIGVAGGVVGAIGLAFVWPWLAPVMGGMAPNPVLAAVGIAVAAGLALLSAVPPGLAAMRADPAAAMRAD